MSGKITLKGEVARDALLKFPKASENSIAKKLHAEDPIMFPSLDSARNALRWHGGKTKVRGEISKSPIKRDTLFTAENNFGIEESDEREWTPYTLPTTCNNILVLSDIHFPYHNVKALTCAIDFGIKNKVNTVMLNGDIMDCYQLSSFEKDPRKRRFSEELDMTRRFFEMLTKKMKAKVFYKLGNHEERWQRFLRIHAPQICDMDEFRLRVILNCDILGIEVIEDKRIIKAGKINIMHGHEFGKTSSAVNPARTFYLKAKQNVICGHLHQPSEHTEPNLNGELTTAFSTGCLCDLNPDYAPINRWAHGFAHITINKDKTFKVRNYRILNGQIL